MSFCVKDLRPGDVYVNDSGVWLVLVVGPFIDDAGSEYHRSSAMVVTYTWLYLRRGRNVFKPIGWTVESAFEIGAPVARVAAS